MNIPFFFLRADFIVGLVMFAFLALMVASNDFTVRGLLLVPVVLLYTISKLLYSIDQNKRCDEAMAEYKKKFEEKK